MAAGEKYANTNGYAGAGCFRTRRFNCALGTQASVITGTWWSLEKKTRLAFAPTQTGWLQEQQHAL
jgi:hypothetical protein